MHRGHLQRKHRSNKTGAVEEQGRSLIIITTMQSSNAEKSLAVFSGFIYYSRKVETS